MLAALAPLLTDSWAVLLAWLLGTSLPPWLLLLLQAVGGAYLIYLGISGLRSPPTLNGNFSAGGSLRAAVAMNLTNPHMYAFWFLVGAPLLHQLPGGGPWAFLLGFYLAIVGSKMALAILAARLRRTPIGPASSAFGNWALIAVGAYMLFDLWL